MRTQLKGISPKVLRWARLTSGYSIEEVAKLLNKSPDAIQSWEKGEEYPSYTQLERLAYKVYKRPLALFFFPTPPEEPDQSESFRTLPNSEFKSLDSDTRFALRFAKSMQMTLHEINDSKNPAKRFIFRELPSNYLTNVEKTVVMVREYLGISFDEQKKFKSVREATESWRNAIQEVGIFVFKRSFKQREISGFCLLDEEFPIIYINNSNTFTRQVFTLFHELAHILLGEAGITKRDISYIGHLTGKNKKIEVFCNKFASEFLFPNSVFEEFINENFYDESTVSRIASKFKVSREVVLRKALDLNLVDSNYYNAKAQEWAIYAEKQRRSGSGGNYYSTQSTYLGKNFINLAFQKFYQGKVSRPQLADVLNIKVSGLTALEPIPGRGA